METKLLKNGLFTWIGACMLVVAGFFAFSCDANVNAENESIISGATDSETDAHNSSGEALAYIQFAPASSVRMIFNTPITEDDITGVVLTGTSDLEYNLSREWDSLDEMLASVIAIQPDTWTFVLTLQKDSVDCLGCTIQKTIATGNQTILFELQEVEEGEGEMQFTLVFPQSVGVKSVTAGLYQTGSHDVLAAGMTEATLTPEDTTDDTKAQVSYTLSSVPAGTYYLKFFLYDEDGLYINRWGDYIRFAPACETTGSKELTAVELLKIPAVPTGLYVSAKTTDSVTLAWSSVTGAENYKVYYGIANNANNATCFGSVESNACTVTGLNGCQSYYFWVSAVNAISGESQKSASVLETTKINKVGTVSIAQKTTESIKISWEEVTGAEGYYVYYNSSDDFDSATQTASVTDAAYTLTGLTSGDTWYFWVSTWNSDDGETDASDVVSAVVSAAYIDPPENINTTSVSTSSVTLSWDAVSGVTGYQIYKSDTNDADAAELVKTQTGVSASLSGLSSGTVYYFWVRSLNSTNDPGDYSAAFTCKTSLAAPQNIFAAADTTTSVEVTWDAVVGAEGYDVYYGTTNSIASMTKAASTTKTTYTVTGLTTGTTYFFRVRATDSSTESTASSGVSCIPTQPAQNIKVSITPNSTGKDITVTWDAVTNATKYKVVVYSYDYEELTSATVNVATAAFTSVATKTYYRISVFSYVSNCWSIAKPFADLTSGVVILPSGTDGTAGTDATYVLFGDWPQTIKAPHVTVDETQSEVHGLFTYYLGSDDNWYVRCTEKAYTTGYKYSNGATVAQSSASSTKYFKVEPIKWRVLTINYNGTGNALLLAENILTSNIPYYLNTSSKTISSATVYANNYKYSTIRAFLNGSYETSDTQTSTYTNKGFLQSAFTTSAQALIATTNVDNSSASTTDMTGAVTQATSYSCANTSDKIFLLSEYEVTMPAYGFGTYSSSLNARVRVTTDYAKANYAFQSATSGAGGVWWLRSPYSAYYYACDVNISGGANTQDNVSLNYYGVVPALSISLQ